METEPFGHGAVRKYFRLSQKYRFPLTTHHSPVEKQKRLVYNGKVKAVKR